MLIAIAGILVFPIVITTFLLKNYISFLTKKTQKRRVLPVVIRKYHFADLSFYRAINLNIAMVLVLIAVITAFEWKTLDDKTIIDFEAENKQFEEFLDIPPTEIPPKPKPIIKSPVIEEVKDEIEPEDIDIVVDPEDLDNLNDLNNFEMPEDEDIPVYESPDKPIRNPSVWPVFIEYDSSFARYLYQNLEFPESARRLGIEGVVYVEFTVAVNGEVKDVKLAKGVTQELDEAALHVIRNSPKWAPGRQGSNITPVRLILPIKFSLGH
jgi:protein TonB